jgi:hypothetical protein
LRRSDELEQRDAEIDRLRGELRDRGGELAAEKRTLDELAERFGPIPHLLASPNRVGKFLSFRPPGHFYSPVPDLDEAEKALARTDWDAIELQGVAMNPDGQTGFFSKIAPLAREIVPPDHETPEWRYNSDNTNLGIGDALVLGGVLRHQQPSRYLEIGSGWSTALALDVNDRFLDGKLQITAIEPYPETLEARLRPGDALEVLPMAVQDVPLQRFEALEAGDVLFIDCSHVVKTGSDAHHIVTRVLPAVPPGVVVHIHDMIWPFEYKSEWVEEGRAWSEAYLVHAFLLYNTSFEILLFNHWLSIHHHDLIRQQLPAMMPNTGASLWLQRLNGS